MQLSQIFLGALMSVTALALPSPVGEADPFPDPKPPARGSRDVDGANAIVEDGKMMSRKVCTEPNCTAYCEDGLYVCSTSF